mgnify:CR=1 FL=1
MTGMIRPYQQFVTTFLKILDAVIAGSIFLILWRAKGIAGDSLKYYEVLTLTIALATPVCLGMTGTYRGWRFSEIWTEVRSLLAGCLLLLISLVVASAMLKVTHIFSRLLVAQWFCLWCAILILQRVLMHKILRNYRRNGQNSRTAVIVGAGETGRQLCRNIVKRPDLGVRILGLFDDKETAPAGGKPIMGGTADVVGFVKKHKVDIVYLALPMRAEKQIKELATALADTTSSVYMAPDLLSFDLLLSGHVSYLNGMPTIALWETPFQGMSSILKRVSDVLFSSIMLIMIAPLMLFIAILVKLSSKGPAFFIQWRYGLNGELIRVYKFRSMRVCEDGYQFVQCTKGDPRVTKVGAILRKTSLDELPQFINVLFGDMSVVGPRPHAVAQNEQYRKLISGYMIRHKIKPGITGLAQVNGFRGETDTLDKMEGRVMYDLEYMRKWNLWLDIIIIVRTFLNGLSGQNVY